MFVVPAPPVSLGGKDRCVHVLCILVERDAYAWCVVLSTKQRTYTAGGDWPLQASPACPPHEYGFVMCDTATARPERQKKKKTNRSHHKNLHRSPHLCTESITSRVWGCERGGAEKRRQAWKGGGATESMVGCRVLGQGRPNLARLRATSGACFPRAQRLSPFDHRRQTVCTTFERN